MGLIITITTRIWYIYEMQLGLLIRVKNGDIYDEYATNLNLQSSKNLKSPKVVLESFSDRIHANLAFFKFLNALYPNTVIFINSAFAMLTLVIS